MNRRAMNKDGKSAYKGSGGTKEGEATRYSGFLEEKTDWMEYAACRGEDTELFFPWSVGNVGLTSHSAERIRREGPAKAICSRCPVSAQCLAFAIRTGSVGIWGGTNETERRRLRRYSQTG